jgi:5-methylcytosine-specific restriction enzyme A
MPDGSLKPCGYPCCGELVQARERFCSQHVRGRQRFTSAGASVRIARHDAPGSRTREPYNDRQWRKARRFYLSLHPLCRACERMGVVRLATEVDHIIPHKGDMKLFWDDINNWQGLCKPCHSRKTASEDGGFGRIMTT